MRNLIKILLIIGICGFNFSLAQFDDVYYDPFTNNSNQFETQVSNTNNTFITNNYYEFNYSQRLRRYYQPVIGFSYFNTWYVTPFYYSYWSPYYNPWGWNNWGWNWNTWYNPYVGWNTWNTNQYAWSNPYNWNNSVYGYWGWRQNNTVTVSNNNNNNTTKWGPRTSNSSPTNTSTSVPTGGKAPQTGNVYTPVTGKVPNGVSTVKNPSVGSVNTTQTGVKTPNGTSTVKNPSVGSVNTNPNVVSTRTPSNNASNVNKVQTPNNINKVSGNNNTTQSQQSTQYRNK